MPSKYEDQRGRLSIPLRRSYANARRSLCKGHIALRAKSTTTVSYAKDNLNCSGSGMCLGLDNLGTFSYGGRVVPGVFLFYSYRTSCQNSFSLLKKQEEAI